MLCRSESIKEIWDMVSMSLSMKGRILEDILDHSIKPNKKSMAWTILGIFIQAKAYASVVDFAIGELLFLQCTIV